MKLTLEVNEQDLDFDFEIDDYNKYLNEVDANDKVGPSYNFLVRIVTEASKEALKTLALMDGKPNGIVVLQLLGAISEEIGGKMSISIKKPKATPKSSKPTVTKY